MHARPPLYPFALLLLAWLSASQAETTVVAELRAFAGDTAGNPLAGELGKTADDDHALSGLAGLQSRFDLDVWHLEFAALRYPSSDKALALTEAFAQYRPIPDSAWRNQWRTGLFYAPLSVENTEPLWHAKGFLSNSAINTWLAEEVRSVGIEWRGEWLGQRSGGDHDLGVTLAVICCNDPAGGLLSWRGWALHNRQYGWAEETEFADIPALADDGSFRSQEQYGTPLTEIDDHKGYYAGLHWRYRNGPRVALMHYDNRGDPLAFEEGQWAWYTEFDHLSLSWQIHPDWTVLLQWLDGYTEFGRRIVRKIDNGFEAWFVSVAYQLDQHRLSIRLDGFSVDDNDLTPDDNNNEDGNAFTMAWQWQLAEQWQLLTEAMQVDSERPARQYFGDAAQQTERTLQLAVRFTW